MSIESKVIERIKFYMRKRKISQEKLANGLQIDRTTVTHILTNRTKLTLDRLIAIANILQIDAKLLTEGSVDFTTDNVKLSNAVNEIPFIAINCVHHWRTEMQEAKSNPDHFKMPFNSKNYSDKCFFSTVETDILAPLFNKNDEIVVDPLKSPNNGNYVIARILSEKINIIRQYFKEGEKIYFKSNQNLPLENYDNNNIEIIGVIIRKMMELA